MSDKLTSGTFGRYTEIPVDQMPPNKGMGMSLWSRIPTMPMLTYAAKELPVRVTSDTCDMYLVRR